jgi:imidazole glycerol-phosphate synthase subunit HisF
VLRPRIAPCLLVHDGGLVKTVRFAAPTYVGDPINAVKIFNEKEADELIVLDIDASVRGREPDYRLIAHLAVECRMPLCYGGGVKTAEQVKRIVGLGVEKVAISSAAIENPTVISRMAEEVGSQSVIVVCDVRRSGRGYEVWTHNGSRQTGKLLDEVVRSAESLGAGEILVNAIDHDGQMTGYDLVLAKRVRNLTTLPMTVLGGAGSLEDIARLIEACGVVGAAAGSLFVFKGPYRAVLINYPAPAVKEALLRRLAPVAAAGP